MGKTVQHSNGAPTRADKDTPGRIDTETSGVDRRPDAAGAVAGVIELKSGAWVDILNLSPEDIIISDVAHGLGNTGRFSGQTSRFYSVAEHSVLCAALMSNSTDDPDLLKAALLHDFHEAYLGDIPTPIKKIMTGLDEIAERMDQAVGERFGIDHALFSSPEVKRVDHMALSLEAHRFMSLNTPGFRETLASTSDMADQSLFPNPAWAEEFLLRQPEASTTIGRGALSSRWPFADPYSASASLLDVAAKLELLTAEQRLALY